MTDINESQRRYLALFSEYVDVDSGRILDEEFQEDIKALHDKMPVFGDLDNLEEESKRSTSDWWIDFLLKYEFNNAMSDFLEFYVQYGVIRPSLINSGIYLVSEADKTAKGRITSDEVTHYLYEAERIRRGEDKPADELKLVIPAGVTQSQVKDFLQEHWKTFVVGKQELYRAEADQSQRRVKTANTKLITRVKDLINANTSYDNIAKIINQEFEDKHYGYSDIAQIVYVHKIKKSQR